MARGGPQCLEAPGDAMSRRHVLVSYDISDEKRVKKVQKIVSDVADRVQFSVYYGQFSKKDLVILKDRLRKVMNQNLDQVLFLDLGAVHGDQDEASDLGVEHLGRSWIPRERTHLIF